MTKTQSGGPQPVEMPRLLTGSASPAWWAMMLLVVIESVVFATLLTSYFYLLTTSAEWPPPGVGVPDLFLPIVNTAVLFASSIAVFWAGKGIERGNQRQLKIGVTVGVGLEVVFFVIKVIMEGDVPFGITSHAYGSIFWTVNRLHTAHVMVAILMATVVAVLAWRGHYTASRRLGVQVVNIYWQFVTVIWIPVFTVLFLVPRWM